MKVLFLFTSLILASSGFALESPKPTVPTSVRPKPNLEAIFKRLDANADGSLTKEEWGKSRVAKKNAERAEKRFVRKDKNADGKLTKEEFTAKRLRKNKS